MTEYKAQQFTVEPDPGDPAAELSLRKLDQFMTPVAQIAFGNDSNTYLSFQSNPGGAMAEQMRIHANGNVGIGTATPGEKLEVAGTVKATAFDGDGAKVMNLDGSQITTGTITDARLPLSISRTADVDARFEPSTGHDHDGVDSKKIPALSTAYFDSLNGASLTDLNGSQITTGTVAAARIDTAIVRTSELAVPNGIATLDSNTLVVQNPANATATPTASKIPIGDASGKLAAGWGGNASTLATLDANIRVVETANTLWDGTAGRSASPTPAANAIPVRDASGCVRAVSLFDRYFHVVPWMSLDGFTQYNDAGATYTINGLHLLMRNGTTSPYRVYLHSNSGSGWQDLLKPNKKTIIEWNILTTQGLAAHFKMVSSLGFIPPSILTTAQFGFEIDYNGNIYARTSDGKFASTVTTIGTLSSSEYRRLRLEYTIGGPDMKFFLNDALVATHTTNLPTMHGYFMLIGYSSQDSTVRYMYLRRLLVEAEY